MGERELSERDIEAAFVEGHWEYGALVHRSAAEALVEKLGLLEASDVTTRHTTFLKLFAEYAGCLETYGAWGWSLQNREERGGLFRAYFSYANNDIAAFFRRLEAHEDGTLIDFLMLPPEEIILEAAANVMGKEAVEPTREMLTVQYEHLQEAADLYLSEDRVVIEAYNKTKHGAVMARLFEPENPGTFEVILRNPLVAEEGKPYRFAKFTVDADQIKKLSTGITAITNWIAELAGLTKILREAGCLYEAEVPRGAA
jgi:hypothetical protein